MLWQPIRKTKQRAVDTAIGELARKSTTILTRQATQPRPGTVGLAGGLGGAVVMDSVFGGVISNNAGPAHRRLALLAARIRNDTQVGMGLFTGHTGALWALAHSGTSDPAPLAVLHDELTRGLDTKAGDRHPEFDLISGVAGLLHLTRALGRGPTHGQRMPASTRWLIEQAGGDGGWVTPVHASRRKNIPDVADGRYYIDWGVAHGAAGAAASVARERIASGNPLQAEPLLDTVSSRLLALADEDRHRLPTFSGPRGVHYSGSLGWCYGGAGVAASLALAWLSLGNDTEADTWLELSHRSLQRAIHDADNLNDGLCHGLAGLLLIACRLFNETDDRRFCLLGRALLDHLIPRATDVDRLITLHGPGLLQGAGGVALALHAAYSDVNPTWDSLFCLS